MAVNVSRSAPEFKEVMQSDILVHKEWAFSHCFDEAAQWPDRWLIEMRPEEPGTRTHVCELHPGPLKRIIVKTSRMMRTALRLFPWRIWSMRARW